MLKSRDFQNLKEGEVLFVKVNPSRLLETASKIFFHLPRDTFPLYITVNRPFEALKSRFLKSGVNPNRILFIDCITRTASKRGEKVDNCIYLPSPANLTEMGIAISEFFSSIPNKRKVIVVDTLSTLLLYNNENVIAKFTHFIINKIKLNKQNGIFLVIEDQMDKDFILQIEQFVDKVIKV